MVDVFRSTSRYRFINRFRFDDGVFYEQRDRINFQDRPDNRSYTVGQGDNLMNIAFRFFTSFRRPASLWWLIMDFNNIHDPSIPLELGTQLFIPSEDFAKELTVIIPRQFLGQIQDLPA